MQNITPALNKWMVYIALAVCCNILPWDDRNDKKKKTITNETEADIANAGYTAYHKYLNIWKPIYLRGRNEMTSSDEIILKVSFEK